MFVTENLFLLSFVRESMCLSQTECHRESVSFLDSFFVTESLVCQKEFKFFKEILCMSVAVFINTILVHPWPHFYLFT